jgi:alkaline phosphatase
VRRYWKWRDILLGGGLDQFLPKGTAGSQRTDDSDPSRNSKLGYQTVSAAQLQRASSQGLGLFDL